MVEVFQSRLWGMRGVYLLLCLVIVFFDLLPLRTTPMAWAPPDLLLALSFVWSERRPGYVPTIAAATVFLLADFLLQRPPGLWAALSLIAVEWARSHDRGHHERGFAVEWLGFAGAMIAMVVVYRLVMAITVADPGPLHLAATQAAFTILIYPLVVLVSHFIFRVRRLAPGDLEAIG